MFWVPGMSPLCGGDFPAPTQSNPKQGGKMGTPSLAPPLLRFDPVHSLARAPIREDPIKITESRQSDLIRLVAWLPEVFDFFPTTLCFQILPAT